MGTPDADSVLTGKLINDTKRVLIEDQYDQPRETEVNMAVEVRWVNRKGDLLTELDGQPQPQDLAVVERAWHAGAGIRPIGEHGAAAIHPAAGDADRVADGNAVVS